MVNQAEPAMEVADLGRMKRFRVAMAWMALARRNPSPPLQEGETDEH